MPDTADIRLTDREAIRELRARYTHYYDDRRLDDFLELFTEDAVLQLGILGPARGREQMRRSLEGPMREAAFAVHFTSDEITEFTGDDEAVGRARFSIHYGRRPNIEGAGTYHDVYRRTEGRWRFASRTMEFFYMGERAHQWPPTPPPQG
ncbi:MAG: nuclear transport factor 2 family protein [Chloroflexi bacterium]|nr:MAG: nuclear transport factor 2 family protein [Chloroflexota bacterium]